MERWKWALQLAIVVFQAILLLFSVAIGQRLDRMDTRFEAALEQNAETHEKFDGRVDELEKFAARGDHWTAAQAAAHQVQMLEEMKELWVAIGEVKTDIARHHGE